MKVQLKINASRFMKTLKDAEFDEQDLLDTEGNGARVLINGMRMRVPVDTAATKNSIDSHIQSATAEQVIDLIGADTNYAPYIELGVASKPNYPIQPFVRPTVDEDGAKAEAAISAAFVRKIEEKWK